jgi:hypothetical protein
MKGKPFSFRCCERRSASDDEAKGGICKVERLLMKVLYLYSRVNHGKPW